ncbi:MAG TPA: MFS transporter [Bryobacteraceae bacterium]|nr:MFS transporter [Bryobacteraceae bacterium]
MEQRSRFWWINRNVAGMTVTSFCADVGYEMVNAVLPGFLASIGVAAAALGWIEGAADALSSFVKLAVGWYSDRVGRRKPVVTLGYFLSGTALSVFVIAVSWPLVLAGRVVAWFGKGIRGPLRDAMLAEFTVAEARGRVFGLHRAGDTAGAVLGPLIGVWLLRVLPRADAAEPFRGVFLFSLIPGLIAVASMVFLVKERRRPIDLTSRFWSSVRNLPSDYRRLLNGVGLFGAGDFAHTLLVLAAVQLLAPEHGLVRAGELAALLYALHNVVYAAAAFPVGMLADRFHKQSLLAVGYLLGAVTGFAVAGLFAWHLAGIGALTIVFALAGIYLGFEDTLEGAIPAGMISPEARGTAYGVMGAVNGIGDLIASALVGTLWTAVSPAAAFASAGVLMLAGSGLTAFNRASAA